MKYFVIVLSFVTLVLAILINNGLFLALPSESESASLGVILLFGSITVAILGIRQVNNLWSKRKKVVINTLIIVLYLVIYLFSGAIFIYSRHVNASRQNVESKIIDGDLTRVRKEFIIGLNKTLSTIGEQSNNFYSVSASYEDNDFRLLYKMESENDISLNDGPIDALVSETLKTFKSNGTIETLKSLKFTTLTMTYTDKIRENSRKIDINKN